MEKQFNLPKRIKDLAQQPLEKEAHLLETEYMKLLDKQNPNEYDLFLIDYAHKRCNKLWRKISRKS